jgi:hypothetical protein
MCDQLSSTSKQLRQNGGRLRAKPPFLVIHAQAASELLELSIAKPEYDGL